MTGGETIRVPPLMKQIEDDVRSAIRRRLVKHGMPAYADEQVFERVRATLQHAADGRDLNVLLLPELLGDEVEWSLVPNLTLSSHRSSIGTVILLVKRRILLASAEELAVENARLRADLDALRARLHGGQGAPG